MLDQPRETVLGCTVGPSGVCAPSAWFGDKVDKKIHPQTCAPKTFRSCWWGPSGGSIMRRPGSEDPHGRELKVDLWRAIDDQIYFVNSYFLSTFKCWSIIVLDAVQVLQYQDIII